jgi:iron complex transport system ATP-binding protein
MSVLLEISALSVRRGRANILDGIDWRIRSGEHWAILGANGSGKTTLLKTLTGYMSPTSGEIMVLGQKYGASDWRDLRLKVGVVTSAFVTAIPAAESALETVISGRFAQLDLWHRVTRRDRVDALAWLKFVGLGRLADREWTYLSQGERQRVLIARALMTRPQLLILDEPCSGLDPISRQRFLAFLERLAKKKGAPTLVLVTHHVEEIVPVFTHVLMLRAGRVCAAGPRRDALTSETLTRTFGTALRLTGRAGRYGLEFPRR